MFSSLLGFALLSLVLPAAFATPNHAAPHRRHAAIAPHVNATVAHNTTLESRGEVFSDARLTYYEVGLGACGKYNVASDFIVALNTPQYGGGYPGPNCFRTIAITYNGKTLDATIMDECPGCPYKGLDLSEGLFAAFDSLDKGVLYASWEFTDGGDGGGDDSTTSSSKPKPTSTKKTTTSTKSQTPTSTWTPWTPPPSSSKKTSTSTKASTSTTSSKTTTTTTTTSKTTSTSSQPSTTTSKTSTTSSKTTSSTTASSTSSALPTPTSADTLGKLEQSFIGLTNLMVAAEVAV